VIQQDQNAAIGPAANQPAETLLERDGSLLADALAIQPWKKVPQCPFCLQAPLAASPYLACLGELPAAERSSRQE